MGYLFRVLSKELFSLGTLFFLIVPFVLSMTDDYAARQKASLMKNQAQASVMNTFQGAKANFSFAAPGFHSGKGSYVNGRPIHIPRS